MEPTITTKYGKFNVSVRFCINLCKHFEKETGKEIDLLDAASALITGKDYSKWITATMIAYNSNLEVEGKEPVSATEYAKIVDAMGFKALSDLVREIWEGFEAVNTQELKETSEPNSEVEKKK